MSLDEIYNLYGYCPTFIKIDVEGMELPVLQGAEQTIRECDVDTLKITVEKSKLFSGFSLRYIDKSNWSAHPYTTAKIFAINRYIYRRSDCMNVQNSEALEETPDIVNFVQINEKAGFKLEDYMITWKNSSAIIKQHEDCD